MAPSANAPKVLVVLESGDASPSGLIRGLLYKSHFEKAGVHVDYVSRRSAAIVKAVVRTGQGASLLKSPLVRPLFWVKRGINRLNEERIVRRAANYDAVYLLKTDSATFEAGIPKELFEARMTAQLRNRILVTADGKRFLVNTPVEETLTLPMTVVLNWPAAARR